MKNAILLFLILLNVHILASQTTISGTVTDIKNNPIAGANVYLEGTYDGASTSESGQFSFETSETGTQTLVISMISYEPHYEVGDVSYLNTLNIQLKDAINALTGVTLTAGTFEAGDNSKVSVLKPLDIVTTAGAVGDFVAALQTLPGTTSINEDGRLFVRGGDANETQLFIDGLRVFQPFNATPNNIPTRARFSPFLFKGISFSTGGYSAEYGQALSSVLLLNTIDLPDQDKTDISIMSVGGGIGHTKIWGNTSLSLNTNYINFSPYEALIPSTQGIRWNSPYESISGESVFRNIGDKSTLKVYTAFNRANLDIEQEDINFDDFVRFRLTNSNLYFNTSYKYFFDNDWTLSSGAAISWDANNIGLEDDTVDASETATHFKVKVKKVFSNRFNFTLGSEFFLKKYDETFLDNMGFEANNDFDDRLWAGFAETDIFFSSKLALKLGLRAERSSIIDAYSFAPRVSLGYKPGEKGQFSLAYGDYYQNPQNDILRFNPVLDSEKTSHYIFNYNYKDDGKTFIAEAYYKDYDDLVKFNTELPQFESEFTNDGRGYASGLDVFWRDNNGINNLDYWISYSYLNTERDYRNFRDLATPNFAPRHNFSLVTKYWVEDLRSQIGLSYVYNSGRPYDNPNTTAFLGETTRALNNVNFSWSYLIDQQKILFISVNNILGFENINNYQYANTPNANGVFDRRAITPAADSFIFVGFFWTISADGKSNQLDNL